MAKDFKNDPIFNLYFRTADRICERHRFPKPSLYAFTPELLIQEQQERVESIALFTFQIALTHRLIQVGFFPGATTGHSFGEFAAIVASGALSFEEGLEQVIFRESILPERNALGYMIAIAASESEVETFLRSNSYVLSNLNTSNQTVISVSWDQVPVIESILVERNIKFKRLQSPQPFHSPWLEEQANKMSDWAKSTILPTFLRRNFFSSVTKEWFPIGVDIKTKIEEALGRQLVAPVDFRVQIDSLAKEFTTFIELGPRPLLQSLIQSNLNNGSQKVLFALDIISPVELPTHSKKIVTNEVSQPILRIINSIIAKFTGYQLSEIKIEDRLQEDLGIDSIKTMEISLEILDQLKLPREALSKLQRVKTVGEVAYSVQQVKSCSASFAVRTSRSQFEVFQETYIPKNISPYFSEMIQSRDPLLIDIDFHLDLDPLFKLKPDSLCDILFRFSDNKKQSSFPPVFFEKFRQLCFERKINKNTRLALISIQSAHCLASPFLAFFKALKKERQIRFVTHIIFENGYISETEQIRLAHIEIEFGRATDVKYDSSCQRFEQTLERTEIGLGKKLSGGTLIAIGGAKGITFEILKHLAKSSKWNLYLMGRSPSSDPEVETNLRELNLISPEVVYHRGDALNKTDLESFFYVAEKNHGHIDLVIQSAGIEISRSFIERSTKDDSLEFQSKVNTTQNTIECIEKFQVPVSVLFSSVIARFGNLGQSIYAAANAWAEQLWRNSSKPSSRISIQWPPWDSVGMTKKHLVSDILKDTGLSLLSKDQAGAMFDRALSNPSNLVFSQDDKFLYQGPLNDLEPLAISLTGVFPLQSKLQIEFSLSLSHFPELQDHSIEEKKILPLALTACWFQKLGEIFLNDRCRLAQFRLFRRVELTDLPQALSFQVKLHDLQGSSIQIEIRHENSLIAEGVVEKFRKFDSLLETTPQPSLTRVPRPASLRLISSHFYNPKLLFHGPNFQFLSEVDFDSNGLVRATLNFPWKRAKKSSPWWPVVSLMDAGLQLLGLWGIHKHLWYGLPVGFASASFSTDINFDEPLVWELHQPEIYDANMVGNLTLRNLQGIFQGEIRVATYQKIN